MLSCSASSGKPDSNSPDCIVACYFVWWTCYLLPLCRFTTPTTQQSPKKQQKVENQSKIIVEKKKMEYTYHNYVNYAENYEASREEVFMKVE